MAVIYIKQFEHSFNKEDLLCYQYEDLFSRNIKESDIHSFTFNTQMLSYHCQDALFHPQRKRYSSIYVNVWFS